MSKGTDLGKKVKGVMASGGLVSDELVGGIVSEAIKAPHCGRGFMLDGLKFFFQTILFTLFTPLIGSLELPSKRQYWRIC